jgi:hypothetical protein
MRANLFSARLPQPGSELLMTDSAPKKPPQRPAVTTYALFAITGLLVGAVFQEVRWRNLAPPPGGNLESAEKAFQSGDNQTAATSSHAF